MNDQIRGVSHVGIAVSDMDRSIAFYRGVLGWEQLFDEWMEGPDFDAITGTPGSTGRACGGRIGEVRVELMCFGYTPKVPRGAGLGLGVLSLEVSSAAEAHADMVRRGVPVFGEPIDLFGTRMFFIADPDGQPIEMVEYVPGGPAWGGAYA